MSESVRAVQSAVRRFGAWILLATTLVASDEAIAKNHLWKFTEIYSNADGSIQFIEMQECCGSNVETLMASADLVSNANVYRFTHDFVGPTAHSWALIATAGFAALPGAPTPDFIVPDRFFNPGGDTLRYRFGTDIVSFTTGQLPTDGVHSLERVGFSGNAFVVAVNSPINFAGDTGSVSIPAVPTGMSLVVVVALGVSLTTIALVAMRRAGSSGRE